MAKPKRPEHTNPAAPAWHRFRALAIGYKIVLVVVIALLIFRLFLPGIVKNYVNRKLDELPGYSGHVDDIDIALLRGAYVIKGLVLAKQTDPPNRPFLQIRQADLSVQWGALFHGKLVGEVELQRPSFAIIAETESIDKEPSRASWAKTVDALMPMRVNRLVVTNGRFSYLEGKTDLHIDDMNLTALNLRNVASAPGDLPSTITLTGTSIGQGRLKAEMKANVIKNIPDFNMNMRLSGANLTALNGFLKEHLTFDIERGSIDIYSELKMTDGQFHGYVKPFIKDLKVLNVKKDIKKKGGVLNVVKKAVVGLFAKAVENPKTKKIATKVPIDGNIKDLKTDGWKSFVGILRNAFVKAFRQGIDGEVN
jgi:hypothetical protein